MLSTMLALPGLAVAQYVGCYRDDANRALPVALSDSPQQTVESCIAQAKSRNLRYAGLQFHTQCYGGSTVGYEKAASEASCDTKCAGNQGQTCGGSWFNSIYDTGVRPAQLSYRYVGCRQDNERRYLPTAISGANETIESCVNAAKERGFQYAGLQFWGQCFAGNYFSGPAATHDYECNTPCSADMSQTCGGAWRNSVYATGIVDCRATQLSLYDGTWLETRVIRGSRLNKDCDVRFEPNEGSNNVALRVLERSADWLTVEIPQFAPYAAGYLRVYPRSQETWPFSILDFEILPPKWGKDCEVFAVQGSGRDPGSELILWGTKGMKRGCSVTFLHTGLYAGGYPTPFPSKATILDDTRLRVRIPMMPAGTAVILSRSGDAPPTQGLAADIKVNEIPPVLLAAVPDSGYAGQRIVLSGRAFIPPPSPQVYGLTYTYKHAGAEDLRVRLTWGPGRVTDVVPSHVQNADGGPELLEIRLPKEVASVAPEGYRGTILVYRITSPSKTSEAIAFSFKRTAQSATAGNCPGGASVAGMIYRGQPSCRTGNLSDHPSAYLSCDASGYYCCESAQGAKTKCGSDRWMYPATCSSYCNLANNCTVGEQWVGGAMVGCYE
jgi:hypothetical protein